VLTAADAFDQTAGNLNAKTLPIGGTWATGGGTTDFQTTGSGSVTRSTVSDTAARVAVTSAAAVGATAVKMPVGFGGVTNGCVGGPVVRWVSNTNYIAALCQPSPIGGWSVYLVKFTSGTGFTVIDAKFRPELDSNGYIWVQVVATAAGGYSVWAWNTAQGEVAPVDPIVAGYSSYLASGGANATGKIGFFDMNTSANAATRTYENFSAWTPVLDAAVFASQSATVSWNGVTREDSAGSFSTPVSKYEGDYFYVPPMMGETRSIRYIVVTSRGGPARYDGALDAKTVQMTYTKRRLVVQ
jgi:hypothetical protein